MVRLVGPGGAGKSTTGALLAERLGVSFVDLDLNFSERVGDITDFIEEHGYDNYARENIENYCSLLCCENRPGVMALSSGFMTYERNAHPQYSRVRSEVELCPNTFALLPSFDREVCVSETVRRQVSRPFGRSAVREEVVIRARFEVYKAMPVRKIETMRPVRAVVDELVAALASENNVVMRHTGGVRVAANLAIEYGFSDIDGKVPRPLTLADV
jgi:shikimate kinase